MTSTMASNRQLRALRGATTAEANTAEAIGTIARLLIVTSASTSSAIELRSRRQTGRHLCCLHAYTTPFYPCFP